MAEKVLVSACLLGLSCRYDGGHRGGIRIPEGLCPIPVCPEQLGGLPTPRPQARLLGGDGRQVIRGKAKVINSDGQDVTEPFLKGAREALKLCRLLGIRRAVLKEKSPSCGVRRVWIGDELQEGCGVTTALLIEAGVEVVSSEEVGDGP